MRVCGSTIAPTEKSWAGKTSRAVRRGREADRATLDLGHAGDIRLGDVGGDPDGVEVGHCEQHVAQFGSLAEHGIFANDRAVERGVNLVERHVLIDGQLVGLVGMDEQFADVFGDTQDAQSLGRIDDVRLGLSNLLIGQPLVLGGVELDLLDRGIKLGLQSLASVQGHHGGMLPDDLLLPQAGCLLLLVGSNIVIGIRLQERTAIHAQRLVGKFFLDCGGVRSLANLGDQERDCGRDLGFPVLFDPRRVQLTLPGAEVEPGRSHVGAVQRDEQIAIA